MDILLYLTELLQTRKTVGIVGLGTIYKKKTPGKYDADKHSFVPPSYSLAFTSAVTEDEELAQFISYKRNITPASASYYIGEFAEQMQAQLAAKQEAELGTLGILKQVNDELILIPSQSDAAGFDFYGLPNIAEPVGERTNEQPSDTKVDEDYLTEIEEENKLEEENPGQETPAEEMAMISDEQEVYDEITEVRAEEKTYHQLNPSPPIIETAEREDTVVPAYEAPTTQEEEFGEAEEEPKKGMPFFMKFLIALLTIVALGAIIYFINPQFFNNYFNKNFSGKQDQTIPSKSTDSLINKSDTTVGDSIAKNNNLVSLGKDTVAAIDSTKLTTYEVLVSAVATDKKANKIIANLAKEGVTAKKINLSKTMINISAGTFLDELAAKKHRDSLRKKLNNKGIYIQPIKPKTYNK